jgi:hypothetical protein
MSNSISLQDCKGYSSETNLHRALKRTGLDAHPCRRIICRKLDGNWTAIFLVSEYLIKHGGYACFASQHGFMSV